MKIEVDIEFQASLQTYMDFKSPLSKARISLKAYIDFEFHISKLQELVLQPTLTSNSMFHSQELVYKLTLTSIWQMKAIVEYTRGRRRCCCCPWKSAESVDKSFVPCIHCHIPSDLFLR